MLLKIPRQLVLFLALFVVLGLVATLLYFKGKPSTERVNPLAGFPAANSKKITVEGPLASLALERNDLLWSISSPLQDLADRDEVARLLETLETFTVGSMVSESPDKYAKFDIGEGTGTRIRVFGEGQEPVLDATMGKQATGFSSSYFRYQGRAAVFIANDLPGYLINRSAEEYRLRSPFPAKIDDASKLRMSSGKLSLSLIRSSDTWTNEATGKRIESAWVASLLGKLGALRSSEFATGKEFPQTLGFDKPHLSVTVETPARNIRVDVGGKRLKADAKDRDMRFARTEGRATVLIVASSDADDIISLVKNPPQNPN